LALALALAWRDLAVGLGGLGFDALSFPAFEPNPLLPMGAGVPSSLSKAAKPSEDRPFKFGDLREFWRSSWLSPSLLSEGGCPPFPSKAAKFPEDRQFWEGGLREGWRSSAPLSVADGSLSGRRQDHPASSPSKPPLTASTPSACFARSSVRSEMQCAAAASL